MATGMQRPDKYAGRPGRSCAHPLWSRHHFAIPGTGAAQAGLGFAGGRGPTGGRPPTYSNHKE